MTWKKPEPTRTATVTNDERKPRYHVRPVTTPAVPVAPGRSAAPADDPFIRPAQEDDDGYDPYSDRPPTPEPPFQEDPWR